MPQVTGVRLRYSKTFWFDPAGNEPKTGDIVLVQTERGEELGIVQHEVTEVPEESLKAALKPVIRIASEEDLEFAVDLGEQEKAALPVFRELIEKNKLDMKPVDIEYLFNGDKIVFYFSSDERVDFRSLVRDLAAHFHKRIDMRQVGVRDEARMVGGIGHCGECLCCARLGGEFAPVSIKMAKDQGLPLNPLKISGLCGRLMCCLRYEVEAYRDFNGRAPRKNATIETPRGEGKVSHLNVLRELVTVRFRNEDDKNEELVVPLSQMCCDRVDGRGCPCAVNQEAFDELTAKRDAPPKDDFFAMPTVTFKEKDLDKGGMGDAGVKERGEKRSRGKNKDAKGNKKSEGANRSSSDKADAPKRRRRRRGGKGRSNGQAQTQNGVQTSENQSHDSSRKSTQRPSRKPRQQNAEQNSAQRSTREGSRKPSLRSIEPGQRVPRRRHHNADGSTTTGSSDSNN